MSRFISLNGFEFPKISTKLIIIGTTVSVTVCTLLIAKRYYNRYKLSETNCVTNTIQKTKGKFDNTLKSKNNGEVIQRYVEKISHSTQTPLSRICVNPETNELFISKEENDEECDCSSIISNMTSTSTQLSYYFDVEPNLHFFKLYQTSIDSLDDIASPRFDRSQLLGCETYPEFKAKVHCIRLAFNEILISVSNRDYFKDMGKHILEILLNHSLRDPTECISAYNSLINFVSEKSNHELIRKELEFRKIPCLSFYDVVLDYIILESFDDLEDPPSAVTSVVNNRWLTAGFRELALQTAISVVMHRKRSKLPISDGFFAHFYAILDHVSPVLGWGFLGSDQDLKFKCFLVKESLQSVIRDYFCFDRCRYTSVNDLTVDILRVTDERYTELNHKLTVCST